MIAGCKLHELLPSSLKDRSKFFGSVCAHCNEVIQPSEKFFRALGCIWHMNHFRCFQCNADLQGETKWVTQFSTPAPKFRPFCPPKRILWASFFIFRRTKYSSEKILRRPNIWAANPHLWHFCPPYFCPLRYTFLSNQLYLIFDPLSLRFLKIVETWLAILEPQMGNS